MEYVSLLPTRGYSQQQSGKTQREERETNPETHRETETDTKGYTHAQPPPSPHKEREKEEEKERMAGLKDFVFLFVLFYFSVPPRPNKSEQS